MEKTMTVAEAQFQSFNLWGRGSTYIVQSGMNFIKPNRFMRPVGLVAKGIVSPMRDVPAHIVTPEYYRSGQPVLSSKILAKYSDDEIPKVRKAARLARKMLEFCLEKAKVGVTTEAIDRLAHEEIISHGAYPTPLNYCNFPKSICTSVNEVACHGIPDDRVLQDGDIVAIDVSLYLDGYHGDNCGTTLVGKADPKLQHLIDTTKLSVAEAIKTCKPGS
jgi:methionyl aminopeptidase